MIPDTILEVFNNCIQFVCSNIACYCKDPVSNFTRKRKLDPFTLIHLILQLQVKSVNSELCDYFDDCDSLPSASAFCQQREKLDADIFQRISDLFLNAFHDFKTWNGYHILACDGSDVNIAFDKNDKETFRQNGNSKPFSQLHINCIYDCLNHVYWDTSIDTATKKRECDALIEMIINHKFPYNAILTMDRGYEKFNLIAFCIENKQKFLIRTKDIHSYSSILSNIGLPDEEFDLDIHKVLTRLQTNEVKQNKNKYTFISNKQTFDYFDQDGFYDLKLRVVRFKITEDTYECLVTNLSRDEFGLKDLKEMYHMRWNIETSFKKLKYTVGMMSFHSKKRKFIHQEIYASILLYNLSNVVAQQIEIPSDSKTKYEMKINYSTALTNIRKWLKKNISTKELIKRLKKYLVPIRPDRKYKRNMKPKSVVPFINKAS